MLAPVQDVFTNEEARVLAIGKFRGELARTDSSKMAVKKAASSLAKAALAKGSRDNVTVVRVCMANDRVECLGRASHHHRMHSICTKTPFCLPLARWWSTFASPMEKSTRAQPWPRQRTHVAPPHTAQRKRRSLSAPELGSKTVRVGRGGSKIRQPHQ